VPSKGSTLNTSKHNVYIICPQECHYLNPTGREKREQGEILKHRTYPFAVVAVSCSVCTMSNLSSLLPRSLGFKYFRGKLPFW
jgi:hypothetical protein